MQLGLRSPAKKLAAGVVLLLSAGSYCALSASRFLATCFADESKPERLHRATRLDAGSAEYPYKLGEYYLLARQSPQDALPWLRWATSLDPYSSRYWIDLAIAQQSLGHLQAERESIERALAVDPRTPDIAWEAANLYLAQGSSDEAMREFHDVLENDPPLTAMTLNTCWRMRPDIDFLLANVVPPTADTPFLQFLISRQETAAADKVWEKIFSLQQPVERQDLLTYTRYLITHQDPVQAASVWAQAANLSNLAAYQPSPANLLVNGDFSLEILNGGFDWIHRPTPGVVLALDPNEAHSASRSLRITFDGPGITDAGIGQMVAVEPNTRYDFTGFYKAQDMDGAGAMEFSVQDLYRDTSLYMGEDLRDADFWKKMGGSFTTGPDTKMVLLHLVRVPPGSPIRGKLWIDGLQLVRSDHNSSAGEGSQ